jgi:hypothetical protein
LAQVQVALLKLARVQWQQVFCTLLVQNQWLKTVSLFKMLWLSKLLIC